MKKKSYSKGELKARRGLKYLTIFALIVIIITILFFVFVVFKNNIITEKIDYSATEVSDDVVSNSTPIILNNIVLGAVYNNTWVAPESYYFRNQNKLISIDIYNESGKKGKYNITNFTSPDTTGAYYVTTNNPNSKEEFFAVGSSDENIMMQPSTKQLTITDEDIEIVKDALGKYLVLNTTVKINSIHNVVLNSQNRGKIICVTNEVGKSSGAYSAVVYVSNFGDSKIVKYNYVKNLAKSSDWPIYSFKFAADLNKDGMNDLIIQETREFEVKYDVIEFRNDKFVEVLSTKVKI